jgi:hypothetical protein
LITTFPASNGVLQSLLASRAIPIFISASFHCLEILYPARFEHDQQFVHQALSTVRRDSLHPYAGANGDDSCISVAHASTVSHDIAKAIELKVTIYPTAKWRALWGPSVCGGRTT